LHEAQIISGGIADDERVQSFVGHSADYAAATERANWIAAQAVPKASPGAPMQLEFANRTAQRVVLGPSAGGAGDERCPRCRRSVAGAPEVPICAR
jgi:hypothetical protein